MSIRGFSFLLLMVTFGPAHHAEAQLTFGSYGRVGVGAQPNGQGAQVVRFTRYGPRIQEQPYAEVDFTYRGEGAEALPYETRLTLSLGESLFHADGNFESSVAVRNLYLEWRDIMARGLSVWAGSRMYRGDDVYLLDFWPLDEQNTLGAGLAYTHGRHEMRLHLGVHRLDAPFQVQTIEAPDLSFGTRPVTYMERQRGIVTLKHTFHLNWGESSGLKWVTYGELHGLPRGVYRESDLDTLDLPSDWGHLLGAELSLYDRVRPNRLNLFFKYATGLATVDELEVPTQATLSERTTGSRTFLAGVSGNYETRHWGLLVGGYARYGIDSDDVIYDFDDRWEVVGALRPTWFASEHFHLLTEASIQWLRPNGVSPVTQTHDMPMAVQVAAMPTLAAGRGNDSRPHLRLVFASTFQNDDARALFAPEDPRAQRNRHDYAGLSAEWWFNSSRYP